MSIATPLTTAAAGPDVAAAGPDVAAGGSTRRPAMDSQTPTKPTLRPFVIQPRSGLQIVDLRELYAYRDLFRFLIWRQIKVRYAQSAIGIGWAVIQPLFSMIVFTIIFGRLAGLDSADAPYALFSMAALLPWTYFSNAVTDGVMSLVSEANMLRKVYFPRLLLPLSAVAAKLVDLAIAATLMTLLLVIYRQPPTATIFCLPLAIGSMIVAAAGVSVWLTALAVQYRDIKHALAFLMQLAMYASPVVYSTDIIPSSYRWVYAINPMVGVIETFRASILSSQPMPWDLLLIGTTGGVGLLLTGLMFFRSKEKIFADVA